MRADGTGKALQVTALERRTNYRSVVANNLLGASVTRFRAFCKDVYRREDDLFDAAMCAVLVSLGDRTEARWSRLSGRPDQGGAGGLEIAFRSPLSHVDPDGR
jgi:hypothetical protein